MSTKKKSPKSISSLENEANNLKESIKCGICQSAMKEPKNFACGHSFCKVCVEKLYSSAKEEGGNDSPKCPTCKIDIPPRRSLRTSTSQKSIIEGAKEIIKGFNADAKALNKQNSKDRFTPAVEGASNDFNESDQSGNALMAPPPPILTTPLPTTRDKDANKSVRFTDEGTSANRDAGGSSTKTPRKSGSKKSRIPNSKLADHEREAQVAYVNMPKPDEEGYAVPKKYKITTGMLKDRMKKPTAANRGRPKKTPTKQGMAPLTPTKQGMAPLTPTKQGMAPLTPTKQGMAPPTPTKEGPLYLKSYKIPKKTQQGAVVEFGQNIDDENLYEGESATQAQPSPAQSMEKAGSSGGMKSNAQNPIDEPMDQTQNINPPPPSTVSNDQPMEQQIADTSRSTRGNAMKRGDHRNSSTKAPIKRRLEEDEDGASKSDVLEDDGGIPTQPLPGKKSRLAIILAPETQYIDDSLRLPVIEQSQCGNDIPAVVPDSEAMIESVQEEEPNDDYVGDALKVALFNPKSANESIESNQMSHVSTELLQSEETSFALDDHHEEEDGFDGALEVEQQNNDMPLNSPQMIEKAATMGGNGEVLDEENQNDEMLNNQDKKEEPVLDEDGNETFEPEMRNDEALEPALENGSNSSMQSVNNGIGMNSQRQNICDQDSQWQQRVVDSIKSGDGVPLQGLFAYPLNAESYQSFPALGDNSNMAAYSASTSASTTDTLILDNGSNADDALTTRMVTAASDFGEPTPSSVAMADQLCSYLGPENIADGQTLGVLIETVEDIEPALQSLNEILLAGVQNGDQYQITVQMVPKLGPSAMPEEEPETYPKPMYPGRVIDVFIDERIPVGNGQDNDFDGIDDPPLTDAELTGAFTHGSGAPLMSQAPSDTITTTTQASRMGQQVASVVAVTSPNESQGPSTSTQASAAIVGQPMNSLVDLYEKDPTKTAICTTGFTLNAQVFHKINDVPWKSTSNEIGPDTNYVVVKHSGHRNEYLCKSTTGAFYRGVAEGKWIVPSYWLQTCIKQKCIVDPMPFEIRGTQSTGITNAPRRARHGEKLGLDNVSVCFAGDFEPKEMENFQAIAKQLGICVHESLDGLCEEAKAKTLGRVFYVLVPTKITEDFMKAMRAFHAKNQIRVLKIDWMLACVEKWARQTVEHYQVSIDVIDLEPSVPPPNAKPPMTMKPMVPWKFHTDEFRARQAIEDAKQAASAHVPGGDK